MIEEASPLPCGPVGEGRQCPGHAAAPTRRSVLRAVGLAGAAGAVGLAASACGGEGAANGAVPGAATAAAGTPEVSDPAPPGASALGPVAGIPVGGGKVFASPPVVVTRPKSDAGESGEYKAFSAVCTHTGCRVGTVADNVITCPCHGAEFSAATGAVLRGPATLALPAVPITVVDGVAQMA